MFIIVTEYVRYSKPFNPINFLCSGQSLFVSVEHFKLGIVIKIICKSLLIFFKFNYIFPYHETISSLITKLSYYKAFVIALLRREFK